MRQLSPAGQQAVNDIAQRQGFSTNAVESMLESVINGNGSMAQFSHPEFGGGGQWMSGGMTMIGDMFNGYLKGRVDNLCSELARLISNQPDLLRSGSFQSQSQNGSTQYNGSNNSNGAGNGNSLFAPAPPDWWGPDLRFPNSTGGQNDMRYAYFAQARRLAIDVGGQVTVYDTLDHSIGGVSQQSGGYGPQFSSQYGYVNLSQLPVVSINGMAPMAPAPMLAPAPMQAPAFNSNNDSSYSNNTGNNSGSANAGDVFASIEKLASLQAKGILTSQEFATKKAELLSRL
ncbi:SHOCT domain-containing protein [Rhodoferax sp.]|uniref:SHOCT domain-containing protein n=1 Tax=Rhodoferax sp. TaxID=50421 RepID=UPI0025DBEC3B|nr:SHOCT domain-containing protein [Rhodoferax sp.]